MPPRIPASALALLALAPIPACAPTSEDMNCGTVNEPTELRLDNVIPAFGATVTNDAIVHSFSILDDIAFDDMSVAYLPEHTAGDPDPAFAFSYTITSTTADYTAAAVTWATAPGHVELEVPIIYQTPDGCAFRLPTPLFSYDVDAP